MPVDYSQGKIYTIRCRTDESLIYVGSTVEHLSARFAKHKCHKHVSLYKYVNNPENNTEWSHWYIELYENCPCNSKEELNKRENEVIRDIGTINKKGYYVDKKEYRAKNHDKIVAQQKEWNAENRDKIAAHKKEYNTENSNKIAIYQKEYRAENRDKIAAQRKEYIAKKKALKDTSV
jgi:hypothetical protein